MVAAEVIWRLLVFLLATIIETSVVWLPVILAVLAVQLWFYYIRARWIGEKRWIVLEIKLPREILKTPQAMEVALNALYQTRDHGNRLIDSWIKGEVRTWFSLELVSLGGEVHFYIWTQDFFKNIIEAQLYAQYPGIEIVEVEDYTKNVAYGVPGSDWQVWGSEFALAKSDAYPIRTYVDYGLDEPIKEENKTDPLTATVEFLGTVGPREQVWIQILVQAAKKRYPKKNSWFEKETWQDAGKAEVEKIMKRDKLKVGADEQLSFSALALSPGERKLAEAVERNLAKPAFDCGFRGLYLYPADSFNPFNIVGLIGSWKQYNAANSNGFKPGKFKTNFDYPWQDPFGWRLARRKRQIFDAYRRRSYFYPPYQRKPFGLSGEGLATLFHLPGQVAITPTLPKIESKRAEPPVNLPV